jgi:hypothetical protein
MAGQSIISSTSLAESLGIAAVFMKRIDNSTLLRNLLMHF